MLGSSVFISTKRRAEPGYSSKSQTFNRINYKILKTPKQNCRKQGITIKGCRIDDFQNGGLVHENEGTKALLLEN